jgi:hypothetical protein
VAKNKLKRYSAIAQFVDLANLLPALSRAGVTHIEVGDARVREDAIPERRFESEEGAN